MAMAAVRNILQISRRGAENAVIPPSLSAEGKYTVLSMLGGKYVDFSPRTFRPVDATSVAVVAIRSEIKMVYAAELKNSAIISRGLIAYFPLPYRVIY